MEFGEMFEGEFKEKKMQGVGDFHLRSALHSVRIDNLVQGIGRWREVYAMKALSKKYHVDILESCQLAKLMSLMFYQSKDDETPDRFKDELLELLKIEHTALGKLFSLQDPFSDLLEHLKSDRMSSRYTKTKLELIVGLMHILAKTSSRDLITSTNMTDAGECYIHEIGSTYFEYWGELITAHSPFLDKIQVLSVDHYRMLCDKFTERDNVIIATRLGSKVFPDVYPDANIIEEIFGIIDLHLKIRGNEGYALLKVFEALVTGVILTRGESTFIDDTKFLTSTLDGLEDTDKERAQLLVDRLNNLTSIHHLTQICGLFRLWGHPIINSEAGMEKVKKIGTARKIIDSHIVQLSGRSFKEIFYLNYFRTKGEYPVHKFISFDENDYLHTSLRDKVFFNTGDPRYSWSSWDSVESMKTFDIPETFNLSMIVADSAISPTRRELHEAYKKNKPAMEPTTRRGVLKWMKDGVVDCMSLLNKVNSHPKGLPKNHRAIGLYPKEREMNQVARMFALTTLMLRSYIVVTESMLSDHILPYVPGITMTHSLLQLTKEMIKVTWRQKDDNAIGRSFCINMDFEKWNLNMRKDSTSAVFLELGRLFGLETLYNKTYDIFENSIVYLADGSFVVPVDENLNLIVQQDGKCYIRHIGGFEGLRQKGWTIFTVVVISYICKKLKIDWKLMGQGDNQVLMVTIYSRFSRRYGINSPQAKEDIRQQLDHLMQALISEFGGLSLPLKPLETWISDVFFSYGKTPLFRGVPCAASLKKISRVFYFSNEDLMTLDNALGAVGANAQSAVMADVHPIIPYMIAKWQQVSCINIFREYHPLVGKSMTVADPKEFVMRDPHSKQPMHHHIEWQYGEKIESMVLATLPKTLGGLNTINYFRVMMRGFADPQNMDFQWLSAMLSAADDHPISRPLRNVTSLMINPEVNYSYLAQDVTGLNLYLPTNSTQVIKDMIHQVIDGLNFKSEFAGWFKEVLKMSETTNVDPLLERLFQPDAINIRLIHDILSSSLYGYCDSITSKIDKTVTLSRMALGQDDVVSALVKNEVRFYRYLQWRITVEGNLPYSGECPSLYIRNARRIGWQKEIIGVDTPFPFHFISHDVMSACIDDSYVEVTINEYANIGRDYACSHLGKALPYLGSVTKEKIGSNPKKLSYGNEPLLTRPIKLLRSIGWFISPESNMAELLKNMVRAVSDLNPEDFVVVPDSVKGSMVHRYQDDGTKHGSLWMPLFGPATFIHLSTNSFSEFAKGSKNVTLHFQALLCYLQYVTVNKIFSVETIKYNQYFRCCDDCITDVVEEFVDLPDSIEYDLIPSKPDNPYLFIEKERIPITLKSQSQFLEYVPVVSLSEISPKEMRLYLLNWFSLMIASKLISGGDEESSQGLLDIGGLPRTLYLKLSPRAVERRVLDFLWVHFARQQKYMRSDTYPSWEVVRCDIERTLIRTPSVQFSQLGGFLFWEESKKEYEKGGHLKHKTFPMTPTSIAISCKQALLKTLSDKEEIVIPSKYLLLPSYEGQGEMMIKCVNLARVLNNDSCVSCLKHILSYRIPNDFTNSFSMLCENGHSFISTRLNIARIPETIIDAVMDIAPQWSSETPKHHENCPAIQIPPFNPAHVISNKEIDGLRDIEEYIFREIDGEKKYYKIDMMFASQTRGIYRAIEGCLTLKNERGKLLILGDGYGGTSFGMAAVNKWTYIAAWTYIDLTEGISHSANISSPPMHHHFDTGVDVSPSFKLNSVIGLPGFENDFIDFVTAKRIETVFSDLEWWYIGEDYSEYLIRVCNYARVKTLCLRIFLSNFRSVIRILNCATNCYESWKLEMTENVSIDTNSCWLIMRRPRCEETSKYISRECQRLIAQRLVLISQTVGDLYAVDRCSFSVDHDLVRSPVWVRIQEEEMKEYMREGGITQFLSQTFTALYLEIRVNRRPEKVANMGANTLYYDRDNSRRATLRRLLLIALTMLENIEDSYSYLTREWDMIWDVLHDKSTYSRRYVRAEFWLQSTSRIPSSMTNQEIREIISRVSFLRAMREKWAIENNMEYKRYPAIGRRISFLSKKELRNQGQLGFRISNILSYNIK